MNHEMLANRPRRSATASASAMSMASLRSSSSPRAPLRSRPRAKRRAALVELLESAEPTAIAIDPIMRSNRLR